MLLLRAIALINHESRRFSRARARVCYVYFHNLALNLSRNSCHFLSIGLKEKPTPFLTLCTRIYIIRICEIIKEAS